jgi:deoxyribodipyrimidine photo-lyase
LPKKVEVIWFKRDLRLFDNSLLSAASQKYTVIPLYIWEPELWRQPDMSYRHYSFLKSALIDFNQQLRGNGSELVIKVGTAKDILSQLCSKYPVVRLRSHQETWNLWTYKRDQEVRRWTKSIGLEWCEVPNNGIIRRLYNRDGWAKKWYASMATPTTPIPKKIDSIHLKSDQIPSAKSLGLVSLQPISDQLATREEAIETVKSFLYSRGKKYRFAMSSPITAENTCSRISPYLAFGQLSVREVFQLTEMRKKEIGNTDSNFSQSLKSFSSRLRWHCHFIQKLEDQPNIETNTLHSSFENLRPSFCDHNKLTAWETGMTGYPMIDACMRYLNQTGWLNFRMRAMLVSFASYHLWLDWRLTSKHLARQFLDYEPGIHYSQIQMQSGTTGMNAIRIYNPIKQGIDQDPNGEFIKQWIPELRHVPNQFIHQPWLMEKDSPNYPNPIVDEKKARISAQEKIYSLKKQTKNSDETLNLVQKHASRLRQKPRKKKKTKVVVTDNNQLRLDF